MPMRFVITSLFVITLTTASACLAHRTPGSLTTVKWNETTGRTEVIHRLHTHDAELGVGASLGLPGLSVEEIEGRAQIALYVEAHFYIKGVDKELKFELVGAELSGNDILVYQELAGRLPQSVLVWDDILMEAFPAQLNQVNIEDGESVNKLVFKKGDGWTSYSFALHLERNVNER